MKNNRVAAALALALSAGACLPKDTRPPPARVLLTGSPSQATRDGIVSEMSADGWTISFQRVLVVLGGASLDGDSCSVYSEARYHRVLSLVGAPDQQKLSESFALGQCDFGFGIRNPDSDALLGVGATPADLALMRTAGADRYVGPSGVSIFVQGGATKGELAKTFAWSFRQRLRYRECQSLVDGQKLRGLSLRQNDDVTVEVVLHAEDLFRDSPDPALGVLRFDAIAAADTLPGNQDGDVSLDELSLVPLETLQQGGAYTPVDADAPMLQNLEDYVYGVAAPGIAHFRETGLCTVSQGQMRPD